ncbi:MAG: cytochrome c maturation protein CcmE [Acidimicrobiaceae bacterium]|nr:cytochrome c maturation protein CcmE [Acidimicrobiaceae bacterium]
MTTTEAADLRPEAPPPSKSRSTSRTVLVIVLLVVAVGALLSQGLLKSLNYFVTVDQAWTQRARLGTSTLRLEGVVEPGTIARTGQGASFYLDGSGTRRYFVTAQGSPPQLFQANIPVVVVGHFASKSSPDFLGSQIMVKHSSNYIAAHPGRVRAPNGTVR